MMSHRTKPVLRGRLAGLAIALSALTMPLVGQAQVADGVTWQALRFEAKKLFVSGEFSIALSEVNAQQAASELWPVKGHAALQPCQGILKLVAQMKLMNNRAQLQLWLDPADLQMLQRSRFTRGSEQRLKTTRMLNAGLWWTRREPGRETGDVAPEQWAVVREKQLAFPALATNPYWLDPSSLLLVASSAKLGQVGASLSLPVMTDQQPYRVGLEVAAREQLALDYRLTRDGQSTRLREKTSVLRLDVSAAPLSDTDDEPEFNLLGLTGDIRIYVDANRGIPVLVEGDAESRLSLIHI